ncbi:MAG: DUF4255 domain-containing protein [Caulobacter sp.]|nr:DUF4255 domain-containing protein [Caulobacter sp.]
MTPDLAIASITMAIRQRLQAALNNADPPGGEVRTERPDKLTDSGAPLVNLYLHQLNLNPFMRNNDLQPVVVRTPVKGGGYKVAATQVQTYRVPLKLHYLLSFYGDERSLVPQRLLSTCVAALHRSPIVDGRSVSAAAAALATGLDTTPEPDFETVGLTFSDMTSEESFRLWSTFKATYALSVGYVADTAIVYSAPTPSDVDLVETVDLRVKTPPPSGSSDDG